MQLSTIVQNLQPSATIAAATKAKALKAQGVQVLEFTLGEPDFDTPAHIQEAAIQAMRDGHTHYTQATGIPELKQAICDAYQRDYGLKYEQNQIAVSNGAKHAIHNVLTAICNPGDEVIIPTPYWVSYSALVELTGAIPVLVHTTEASGFCLQPADLAAAITDKTRLVMLNSPSNPTGAVWNREALQAIADVIVEHDLLVMADEIYEKLIYEGHSFHSFATLGEEVAARTIIVSGVSKAYAMTGWRIGWTMASAELTAGMTKLQSQQTSNPCSVSQYAAIAALTGPQDCVEEMRLQFAKRRKYVVERVNGLPNVTFAEPSGAFYVFMNVSAYFGKPLAGGVVVDNSTEFCTALLEQAHVALVTGDAFGGAGYVRLSFATDLETIKAGFDAIEKFLAG
jgi:aspartate aminotransferase